LTSWYSACLGVDRPHAAQHGALPPDILLQVWSKLSNMRELLHHPLQRQRRLAGDLFSELESHQAEIVLDSPAQAVQRFLAATLGDPDLGVLVLGDAECLAGGRLQRLKLFLLRFGLQQLRFSRADQHLERLDLRVDLGLRLSLGHLLGLQGCDRISQVLQAFLSGRQGALRPFQHPLLFSRPVLPGCQRPLCGLNQGVPMGALSLKLIQGKAAEQRIFAAHRLTRLGDKLLQLLQLRSDLGGLGRIPLDFCFQAVALLSPSAAAGGLFGTSFSWLWA
jgi:hypothetical protein